MLFGNAGNLSAHAPGYMVLLDKNVFDQKAGTSLHGAQARCKPCRLDVVRYLAPLGSFTTDSMPAEKLIEAAAKDDTVMVEALLLAGMDPNASDFGHRTPLHLAVANRNMQVMKRAIMLP